MYGILGHSLFGGMHFASPYLFFLSFSVIFVVAILTEMESNKKLVESEKKKVDELTRERDILSKVESLREL